MKNKAELLSNLSEVFQKWEIFLASKNAVEISAPLPNQEWSLHDHLAHLMAWQQLSISRLEAGFHDSEPNYPAWLAGADPFYADEHVDEFNSQIFNIYRSYTWPNVHHAWKTGYQKFGELATAIPWSALRDPNRYPWLKGYPLSDVITGSLEHHVEHLESVSST